MKKKAPELLKRGGGFPVVIELTERALTARPTELLSLVDRLALMPFLRPDVIKLDLKLMQDRPSREIAEVVHAVNAESERTGSLVLAEGIEASRWRRPSRCAASGT
ncbi:MAG: hypothetical protein H0X42_12895 [Solirubrobacterales bacterium]|nr:hypothetical protein [Solirubrobacterales bacterium]